MAGGYCRLRRTDPHRNPSSRNTSRPARSPEPAALCLSVDPPQDLPLSSSTAGAVQAGGVERSAPAALVQYRTEFRFETVSAVTQLPMSALGHAALADPHRLDAVLAHGVDADRVAVGADGFVAVPQPA